MSDVPDAEDAAVPPKEDPETLVLRGTPRPVVRFRRGLIIGLTGAVAAALVTVTWVALEPPSFHLAVREDADGDPFRKASPDALADAPASYDDVPRLGPPLPGDLGRPILEHHRSLARPVPSAGALPAEPDPARAAAEAERQRLAAAREAARASGVIVQLQGGGQSAAAVRAEHEGTARAAAPAAPASEAAAGGVAQGSQLTQPHAADTSPYPVLSVASPWTLSAGTIIPASLITGLNSDLPGTVLAQVTEHVRDSATGRTILIPQGARLIGSYESVLAFGQRRALLVWQRIVLPDGSSLRLDDVPASDLSGHAGVADRVNFHTWRLLKGIALSTLLGVGTELSFGSAESDLVRALRESAQQNAARAGDRLTSRNLDVQPTITVRPGWPLRAVINKDLVLQPWRR